MVKTRILMGGSGSTGSSLLKNILNRHADIYGSLETSLFSKKELYKDWESNKYRVLHREWKGLKSHSWHLYNGVDLLDVGLGYSQKEIEELIEKSTTFQSFADVLFANALRNKKIWIEKTPFNAFCFTDFLDSMEDSKVIHVTRNPYDTIASLMRRGHNEVYATGIYLLNTAAAESVDSDRKFTVKYEDLIQNTHHSLEQLCDFIGVEYDREIIKSRSEIVPSSQLEGWQYDETMPIGKGSVGRFDKEPESVKYKIHEAIKYLRVSKAGQQLFNIKYFSIEELCYKLEYEYLPVENKLSTRLYQNVIEDRLQRIKRLYPTGFKYPITIK